MRADRSRVSGNRRSHRYIRVTSRGDPTAALDSEFAARAGPRAIYHRLKAAEDRGDHDQVLLLRGLLHDRLEQIRRCEWSPLRDGYHPHLPTTTKGSR